VDQAIRFSENDFAMKALSTGPAYARILTLHNFPLDQDVLARAYQKSGHLDEAIEEYKKLITFDPAGQDRRMHNPVYHYRLAKLYEQQGVKEEAKKEYARFLELWRNADPGLPELADAKKRLAQL
jgi:tetratricopeptide (TPR) repeat protein